MGFGLDVAQPKLIKAEMIKTEAIIFKRLI